MSQSDYIKYKRVSAQLRVDSGDKSHPVFDCRDYTDYKQYSLESNIVNTKLTPNQLIPSNSKQIFNMNIKTTGCPSFIICTRTNNRPGRTNMGDIYAKPTIMPLDWKKKKKMIDTKNTCIACNKQ